MPYITLIVDDEAHARSALRQMIARYCPNLSVCAEAGTVAEALAAIQQHRPSLLFLDIDLHEGNGFDILKAFPRPDFKVVFITAHNDYALEAFRVRALHYLLKPIDPQDLIAVTNELDASATPDPELRALGEWKSRASTPPLRLPSSQGTVLVRPEEILYAVSDDKYATLALVNGEKVFVGCTLKELEERLSPTEFLRPHQSWIVRIDAVRKLHTADGLTLILRDQTRVPVSRRNREAVKRILSHL